MGGITFRAMYWYAVYTFPVYTVQPRYARRLHTHVLRSPSGHHRIDYNSLSVTIQPIPYPASAPSSTSIFLQFGNHGVVRDYVKHFAQVQVDDISCSSFAHRCCNSIVNHADFVMRDLPLAKPCWLPLINIVLKNLLKSCSWWQECVLCTEK